MNADTFMFTHFPWVMVFTKRYCKNFNDLWHRSSWKRFWVHVENVTTVKMSRETDINIHPGAIFCNWITEWLEGDGRVFQTMWICAQLVSVYVYLIVRRDWMHTDGFFSHQNVYPPWWSVCLGQTFYHLAFQPQTFMHWDFICKVMWVIVRWR